MVFASQVCAIANFYHMLHSFLPHVHHDVLSQLLGGSMQPPFPDNMLCQCSFICLSVCLSYEDGRVSHFFGYIASCCLLFS